MTDNKGVDKQTDMTTYLAEMTEELLRLFVLFVGDIPRELNTNRLKRNKERKNKWLLVNSSSSTVPQATHTHGRIVVTQPSPILPHNPRRKHTTNQETQDPSIALIQWVLNPESGTTYLPTLPAQPRPVKKQTGD